MISGISASMVRLSVSQLEAATARKHLVRWGGISAAQISMNFRPGSDMYQLKAHTRSAYDI